MAKIKAMLKSGLKNPVKAIVYPLSIIYNKLIPIPKFTVSEMQELSEIKNLSYKRSDISDHLITLFVESNEIKPYLIVELGVRGGVSTFVFERVAKLNNSKLVSVDIEDCSSVSNYRNWKFICEDDIRFASRFADWCKKEGIKPLIDVLFIDTSHTYKQTLAEIKSWFPYLSDHAKVFFHDTNASDIFFRKDHSMGIGCNCNRGVIKAIEKFFKRKLYEKSDFMDCIDGWIIKHYANCNGMTILIKNEVRSN